MDKSQVRVLQEVHLDTPVLVDLTSHPGSPVRSASQLLIERSRAEKVGELYSPYFQDYVSAGNTGVCSLPRLEFHASRAVMPNILVLSGEQSAHPDDVYGFYDIAEAALDYSAQQGCVTYTSCGVFRSRRAENAIYVAATTSEEASALAERLGCKPFIFGRIVSQMGPLLGLAKVRGFKVMSILAPLRADPQDGALPGILVDLLVKALSLTLA